MRRTWRRLVCRLAGHRVVEYRMDSVSRIRTSRRCARCKTPIGAVVEQHGRYPLRRDRITITPVPAEAGFSLRATKRGS